MKVFLSHSSVDRALARRLAGDLQSASIDIWLDQWEIGVGAELVPTIERSVDETDFVIVLLTRASTASDWVDREWRRKFDEEVRTGRVAVIPVRGEPCVIPDFLAQRSYADISGGSYPLGLKHLLEILRHYSGETGIAVPLGATFADEPLPTMRPLVIPIAVEVSADLIPIFEQAGAQASRFFEALVPAWRDTIRADLGFPLPGIRVRGNETDMRPGCALILIEEVPEDMLEVCLDEVLADATVEDLALLDVQGEARDDPASGRARVRIAAEDRAVIQSAGIVTWDAAEYLLMSIDAVVRRFARLFVDIDLTHWLVNKAAEDAPELVAATVPRAVSWVELTDVLQRLVDEGIGVGDMQRILQALKAFEPEMHELRDTQTRVERVRHALSGQITRMFTRGRQGLPVFSLDAAIDAMLSDAIEHTSVGPYLHLDPALAQDILAAVRESVCAVGRGPGPVPILMTVPEARRFMRKIVELEFPWLHVLSRQDLEPEVKIQSLAHIRLAGPSNTVTPTSGGTKT